MLDEVGWSPLGLRIPCDTERSLISGILHRIFLLSEKIGEMAAITCSDVIALTKVITKNHVFSFQGVTLHNLQL